MSANIQTYEVRVEVKKNGKKHYRSDASTYIWAKEVKTFHFLVSSHKKAMQKAQKYGRPLSVHKVDAEKMVGIGLFTIEAFKATNPCPDAIALDEMIWKTKTKRAVRLENNRRNGH